jgi:hypothetical protein
LVAGCQSDIYQPLAGVRNPGGSGISDYCYLLPFVEASHHALGGSIFGVSI